MELAAAPAMSLSGYGGTQVHLDKCWADSEFTRRKIEEGTSTGASACLRPADPGGVGLCPACRADIVGGDA